MRVVRGERKRLRDTQRVLVAALAVYLAVAVCRELQPGRSEIFPFASWSLFSLVPNETSDFSLRVLELDGRALDPPPYLEDAWAILPQAANHVARNAVDRLGRAVVADDEAGAAATRRTLESLHLGSHRIVYELVRRRYDPLERWRTGRIRHAEALAAYRAGDVAPATAIGSTR